MNDDHDIDIGRAFASLLSNAALAFALFLAATFLFFVFAARPLLRLLGGLFAAMGGAGLEGTGL